MEMIGWVGGEESKEQWGNVPICKSTNDNADVIIF